MSGDLLERLRSFKVPPTTPFAPGPHVVARLQGVDFGGLLDSPDFGFSKPFDPEFGKMLVRTASHLLGGDAAGRFAYTEHQEFSVLLDGRGLVEKWSDACDLQCYLVGLASSKMSLQVEGEAVFSCSLYAFPNRELTVAYFVWRRQEALLDALNSHCAHVLLGQDRTPEMVQSLLDGMEPAEKEEILLQNGIDLAQLPAWQFNGAAVYLRDEGRHVGVDSDLPQEADYGPYIEGHLH
jgi:tRNA(His) 5'-end guanylyltransferase